MYETLLFLHVLAAFMLVAGIVVLSAFTLGVAVGPGSFTVGNRLVEIGGTGVLLFGLWITFREDLYDITDGWILGAIVLWLVATGAGTMAGRAVAKETEQRGGGEHVITGRAKGLHWLAAVATFVILVLMIWKPGV